MYMPKGVYKRSQETIQKLVDRNKSMTGRKFSKEHIQKLKEKRKNQKSRKGFTQTEKTKNKISEGVKNRYKNDPDLRKRQSESHRKERKNTDLYSLIRNCYKYRLWRSDVYTRDNFTCVHCGDSKGGNLHPDHIVPLSFLVKKHNITSIEQALECEELWNINNGQTLCEPCHKKTPTWGIGAKKYCG